jgi:DNA replication protein DnaC
MTDPTIAVLDITDPRLDPDFIRDNITKATIDWAKRIPPRYRHAVTELPELRQWAHALIGSAYNGGPRAQITTGPSILLVGPVGTGKTHQTYGVIRALAESGAYCPWDSITATDLYAKLRPHPQANAEDDFNRLARTPLLVIDDLGAGKASEWTEEINYRLINQRYEWERPTLIATNIPPLELRTIIGDRVASRIAEMTTRVVTDGPDRRRQEKPA